MTQRQVIDVSALPDHAFGSRSIMWWSTMTIVAIEGTVFALAIGSYFYLQGNEEAWPPPNTALPGLLFPTINVFILLLSLWPNEMTKRAAEDMDLGRTRRWMVVADLLAVVFVAVRVLEYGQLNVSWDSNAYGSATWTLLGLHTLHLVTDLIDTVVLTVLMFTRHGDKPRRYVDVSENAFYWYFVVLSWIPIYLVLYWAPRWL
ncbi:MAG TPA: cytochrome c oxidase subunit 3 [Thermoanaerobaculia bacterium]|nr:cytochrome c oxidase subunit 3 [Thermoanaerobaculia bacterium]